VVHAKRPVAAPGRVAAVSSVDAARLPASREREVEPGRVGVAVVLHVAAVRPRDGARERQPRPSFRLRREEGLEELQGMLGCDAGPRSTTLHGSEPERGRHGAVTAPPARTPRRIPQQIIHGTRDGIRVRLDPGVPAAFQGDVHAPAPRRSASTRLCARAPSDAGFRGPGRRVLTMSQVRHEAIEPPDSPSWHREMGAGDVRGSDVCAAARSSRSLIDASGLRTSCATPAATRPRRRAAPAERAADASAAPPAERARALPRAWPRRRHGRQFLDARSGMGWFRSVASAARDCRRALAPRCTVTTEYSSSQRGRWSPS